MRNRRHFQRGYGVFECRVCGRKTRNPDHGGTELCSQCFEIAGLDNMVNDNALEGDAKAKVVAECNIYLAEIAEKGGDVERVKNCNDFIWGKE